MKAICNFLFLSLMLFSWIKVNAQNDKTWAGNFIPLQSTEGWEYLWGDFNGDGLQDIAAFTPTDGKVYVSISRGNGFSPKVVWYTLNRQHLSILRQGSILQNPLVGDFNGDEKTDLAFVSILPRGEWYSGQRELFSSIDVALSNGKTFDQPIKWIQDFNIHRDRLFTGDFNGDNQDDIMAIASGTSQIPYDVAGNIFVATSNGSGFDADIRIPFLQNGTEWPRDVPEPTFWAEKLILPTDKQVTIGDLNNDGNDDIVFGRPSEGVFFTETLSDGALLTPLLFHKKSGSNPFNALCSIMDLNADAKNDLYIDDLGSNARLVYLNNNPENNDSDEFINNFSTLKVCGTGIQSLENSRNRLGKYSNSASQPIILMRHGGDGKVYGKQLSLCQSSGSLTYSIGQKYRLHSDSVKLYAVIPMTPETQVLHYLPYATEVTITRIEPKLITEPEFPGFSIEGYAVKVRAFIQQPNGGIPVEGYILDRYMSNKPICIEKTLDAYFERNYKIISREPDGRVVYGGNIVSSNGEFYVPNFDRFESYLLIKRLFKLNNIAIPETRLVSENEIRLEQKYNNICCKCILANNMGGGIGEKQMICNKLISGTVSGQRMKFFVSVLNTNNNVRTRSCNECSN